MSALDPFAYPASPHASRHAPAGYEDYRSFKPWLRDDFAFRCVYCLTRERWDPSPSGHAGFGVDHAAPRAAAPALALDYGNLVYACNTCNSARQADPAALNPFDVALADHLAASDEAGFVAPRTEVGAKFIEQFRLNSPGRAAVRREKLTVLRLKLIYPDDPLIDDIYRRAFGYPDDLPDLTLLRPPGGNASVGSELGSHHARRGRGELVEVY